MYDQHTIAPQNAAPQQNYTPPSGTEVGRDSDPSILPATAAEPKFWIQPESGEGKSPVAFAVFMVQRMLNMGKKCKIMPEDESRGWGEPAEFGFVSSGVESDPAPTASTVVESEATDQQPESNRPQTPDSSRLKGAAAVSHLRGLLGDDVVLLPCDHGKKGPRGKKWQLTEISAMSDPDYLKRLSEAESIAVLLGEPSGDLCSIDIDDDEELEKFLALNPKLSETLCSRGKRGGNLWVRLRGKYPPTNAIKTSDGESWGEWRAAGACTMIHGVHPDGMRYHRSPEVPLIEVNFDEIQWHEHLNCPQLTTDEERDAQSEGATGESDAVVVKEFGQPFYYKEDKNGNRHITEINQAYWAALYAREHTVLYDPDERKFFQYDHGDGLYTEISADRIMQHISSRMLEVSRDCGEAAGLEKQRTDRVLKAIIAQLRGIVERRGAFTDRPRAVHRANCMLVLSDGVMVQEAFSPKFFSRNRSPISYVPDAMARRFFLEFLLKSVSFDDAVLLQKLAGQCLLGENLSQQLLIIDGEGGRGKGTATGILQALVGRQNITQLRSAHLGERFELYRYLSRTLLVGVDVDPGFLSSKGANVIKGLVGGDWFDAEQKGGTGSFHFQGKFNIVMTSNSRLRVKLQGDVGAWRRRLLIIRFEMPPPAKKIPNFAELLVEEEGPGILNWALGGLKMLLRDIEETGGIRLTPSQEGIVESLLVESDSLRFFLRENVKCQKGGDLTVAEIMQAYAHYCPDHGWEPLAEGVITHQLSTLMLDLFKTTKSHSCKREDKAARGYRGVAFINPEVLP
jgi:phage/plasmid-associated DNA primase